MKKLNYPFLILFLAAFFISNLKNAYSQTGAIYSFYFKVDPQLTEYIKINYDRKWFSSFSESNEMPKAFIDSIKNKTELAFSNKLKMPVKMCYHIYKSDVHFTSEGINGVLEGLPEITTFKRGKKDCPQNTRFVSINVNIYASGGTSITFTNTQSKLKPKVQINAKVVDENNDVVWKKEVVLKNFSKLRAETRYYQGYDITKSEVLLPLDIYNMYLLGLEELMKE